MKNVFQLVSNKVWGGIEQYAYDLSSELKKNGNYVEIVCRKYEPTINHFRQLELPISILPLKGMTDFDSPVRFARLIKRNKNIVHVHNFKDAATAILARHISENNRTRIVLTRHFVKKAKGGMIYRKLYKELDKIIFVSELAKDEFLISNPKIDPDKLVVIHDSVRKHDISNSDVPNLREKYNIDPSKVILMFHGRICKEKGFENLLKAISQLPKDSFHLFVIGEGEQRYVSQQKAFIVANQLIANITFLGFQRYVQSFIRQCDVGVLPSVYREPFGLTNLEYMMWGKPHIASDNGAQKEYIINGQTGILVTPDDFHLLTDAISSLIKSRELRDKIGTAAQKYFEDNLSYRHFYEHIDSVYDEVLAK